MALDPPRPGQVIDYPYLWHREHREGQEMGRKIRPTVVLYTEAQAGKTRVYVLPVTTSAPHKNEGAVEVPRQVKEHLRLDAERSWIMTSELNHFEWPGADLHTQSTEAISRGFLPHRMTQRLRAMVRERVREKAVDRDIDPRQTLAQLHTSGGAAETARAVAVNTADDARRHSLQVWRKQYAASGGHSAAPPTAAKDHDRDLGRYD